MKMCSRASAPARRGAIERDDALPSAAVPAKEDLARQAQLAAEPPLLVTTPQYLHTAKVLGIWSLPDRSTPAKRQLEEQLDAAFASTTKKWSSGTGTASGTTAT